MKPSYTYEDILALDFPPVIVYAVPVMIALTVLEWFLRRRDYRRELAERGSDEGLAEKYKYDVKDGLAAAGVGIGNLVSTALVKAFTFGCILFFYNLTPLYVPVTWWSFVVCFVVVDCCRYWAHRVAHEQRFWWATHVTHHSSEQYNFSVSFRLSWTQHIKVIFFIPAALLGFDPFVFFICMQIGVLYQFWIHTELIGRLWAPIEFLFVTPSHHRVHHGSEEKYLDKNYGSTLIIWDRMFGTFCAEEETPNYGILHPVNSYNPVTLVFHEHIDILRDLAEYRHPRAWWRILFHGPGLSLDKEKHYGFYRRKEGGDAGAKAVVPAAPGPGQVEVPAVRGGQLAVAVPVGKTVPVSEERPQNGPA